MKTIYLKSEFLGDLHSIQDSDNGSREDIQIEMTDSPITIVANYNGTEAEISVFVRMEINLKLFPIVHGTVVNGQIDIDKGDEEKIKNFHSIAELFNIYLQRPSSVEKYSDLNDDQGLLFELDGDTITPRIVSGRERPDLACMNLFGATTMMRPYEDEFMSRLQVHCMSLEELEEAANNGDTDATERLIKLYLNGDDSLGVAQDPVKCVHWMKKQAAAGIATAMYNLGLTTAKGFGVKRDFAKAAEWMEKAADAGDPDAYRIAEHYRQMADSVKKAKAGDAKAQAVLAAGLMALGTSLDQAGPGKDYEESIKWAKKSAAQNCPDAFWTLGLIYQHGRGVSADLSKAAEYYRKGSDLGNAECQHNLGCMYLNGEGMRKNRKKGFGLVKASAEQGYGLAMKSLGMCYQFAWGTEGNMKTAVEWYEKALEIMDDPELKEKVMMYKALSGADGFDEDYPEDDEEFDKYMTGIAPDEIVNAFKYEDELDEAGFMPDAPHGDAAWGDLPRVHKKAEEGDAKAIMILKDLDDFEEKYESEFGGDGDE